MKKLEEQVHGGIVRVFLSKLKTGVTFWMTEISDGYYGYRD